MSSDTYFTATQSTISALQEREKELNCLYLVDELLRKQERSIEEVLSDIAKAIPPGWQFPESCEARIVFEEKVFDSGPFSEDSQTLQADIVVGDEIKGQIYVGYMTKAPEADHGPFLKEEIKLISTIAERLGHFLLHHQMREMLLKMEQNPKPGENPAPSEWSTAIDIIAETDREQLNRITRKMMNHLLLYGVEDARELLQRYGDDIESGRFFGESNQPQRKRPQKPLLNLTKETFALAANNLTNSDILHLLQKWIHEDKYRFLIKPLVNVHASLTEIANAMQRYQHFMPSMVELSDIAKYTVHVALIRRFFTEQLNYISIAKKFAALNDFFLLLDRVIYTTGSHGKLGGKSAGLFLGHQILQKSRLKNEAIGNVKVPKTWYLTSDGLHEFVNYNNLEETYQQKYKDIDEVRQEYPHIVQVFKNCYFPQEIIKGLSMALDDFGSVPLIVRSSSLLEDRLGAAFSGKYRSLFLANQGDKKHRLDALLDAIAEVYASTFSPDPIEYRAEMGLLDFNEQMGIMIQEVVGKKIGHYFCPAFSGVAFSHNEFRWSPRIKRDDGLLRMVPGLGTRAVDRLTDDYPILVAIGQPGLRVNATVDETMRYSPKKMDVINLFSNRFETIDIQDIVKKYGNDYHGIGQLVSIYRDGMLKRPVGIMTDYSKEESVVTFDGLINNTSFVRKIEAIVQTLKQELGTAVDIEFASDGQDFYLLQCRPQSRSIDVQPMEIPSDVPSDDLLFTANRYISDGRIPDITHIVYIDPQNYSSLTNLQDLQAVGHAVGRLNKLLPKRQFVLIGPGRWGSRGDIKLGVRVTYSDISNTAMLIEIARQRGSYVPDLSFGTHFFQDLVEASIRYLPLYPDEKDVVFNENFFLQSPNMLGDILPEYEYLSHVVRVIDVPQTMNDKVLRILMNADLNKALGMFTGQEITAEPHLPRRKESLMPADDHSRWRLRMAEKIGKSLDPDLFGVKNLYIFGSAKNATAGPGSDIDLLIHFSGTETQKMQLKLWFEGWSLCLAEYNFLKTGHRDKELLDLHFITDKEIEQKSSFAVKIGAITDAARRIPLGVRKSISK